jgi:hypothetical protein
MAGADMLGGTAGIAVARQSIRLTFFHHPPKRSASTCPRRCSPAPTLAKTIRAMADGTLDSQVGGRICNGLGIMRACLETQKLEQLEARMDEIAHRVARDRTNAARERTSTHEAQRLSN